MTQEFGYNDSFYAGITPVEDLILKHDAVDAAYKKMVDIDTTIAAKQAMIQATTRDKELSLYGFTKAQVTMDDPDSGILPDGTRFRFAGLDALDQQGSKGKKDFAMQLQAKQVAGMYGTSESEVTPEMWQNATNYQYNEFLRSMTDPNAKFEQFDSNRVYNPVDLKNTPLEIAFKPTGQTDQFGRIFVEAINPVSGRRVTDEMSSNPYLSARNSTGGFDLYTALRNNLPNDKPYSPTGQSINRYVDNSQRSVQEIKDAFDTDGRLGETIDMVQSAAYRSAARLLQYGPDFLLDTEKWKNIASEKNGQALADAWAGVKQSTRDEYQQETQKAVKAIEDGDYLQAILISATQFDRLLADSAVQMGLMTAGTLATGGGAAGATLAARLGGMLLGASAASVDVTLGMREQYKENNNGREMPWKDTLGHWAANTALLMPDAFMIGLNASKIFAKPVNEALETAYRLKKLPSRAKIVGLSALEETLQEWVQESYENWSSQDQSNVKSFWEVMKSAESQYAAVAGGVMGGGLSGIAQSTGAAVSKVTGRDAKHDANIKEAVEQYRTTTNTDDKADVDLSTRVLSEVKNISDLNQLTDIVHAPGLSKEAKNAAQQRRIEILTEQVKAEEAAKAKGETPVSTLPEGTTKQSLFEEKASLIFHSDPSISMESKRAQIEEAGKDLGISKEEIKKTIQEVSNDIKHGPKGYYTYRDDIKYYNSEMDKVSKDTTLTEEQRTQQIEKFETAKARTEASIQRLQGLQVGKLNSFLIALRDMATGGVARTRANYPSGGGFDIEVEDIRSGSFKTGNAMFGVINNVKSEINEMTSVMQELGIEPNSKTLENMESVLRSIDANINTIQGKTSLSKDVQKAIKKDKTAPADTTVELTEENLRNQIKTLERLSDIQSKGKKLGAELQGFIISRGEEQIEQIQQYLEANPNEKASKMLSQILANRTESTQRKANVVTNTNAALAKATEQKTSLTEAAVEKLSTVEELSNVIDNLSEVISSLNQVEATNTTAEELRSYYTGIFRKAHNKRLRAMADEINKSKREETKPTSKSTKEKLLDHYKQMVSTGISKKVASQTIKLLEAIAKVAETNTNGKINLDSIFDSITYTNKFTKLSKGMRRLLQEVFHGSPYKFTQFMLDHINSGEGAQVHGWGLYFTKNKDIANTRYRERLAKYKDISELNINGKDFLKTSASSFVQTIQDNSKLDKNDAFKLHEMLDAWGADLATVKLVLESESTKIGWDKYEEHTTNSIEQATHILTELNNMIKNKVISVNDVFGQVFRVQIPDSNVLLHENKKYDEQSDEVKTMLMLLLNTEFDSNIINNDLDYIKDFTGKQFYDYIQNRLHDKYENTYSEQEIYDSNGSINFITSLDKYAQLASEILNKYGIKGIEYNSRTDGTCFVMFDDTSIEILETFYETRNSVTKGAISFLDQSSLDSIITYFKEADASTPPHELAHFSRRLLETMANMENASQQVKDDWKAANDFVGAKVGKKWTTAQEEKFADAFLVYLNEGKAPNQELKSTFDRFARWLNEIYTNIKEVLGVELNSEIRGVFNRLLTSKTENTTITEEVRPTKVEPKNYTINNIFKNVFSHLWNSEAILDVKQQLNRLENELRVGKAESILAVTPVDTTKKYVKQVMNNMSKLMPKVNSLTYLLNEHTSTNRITGETETTTMLSSAPYLKVLYDLIVERNADGTLVPTKNDKGKNNSIFSLRPNVAVAIDFSFREMFSDSRNTSDAYPFSNTDMAKTYGLNESGMSRNEKAQIRELTDTYGVPRAVFAERLGKQILANLGLFKAEDATVGFYERVAVGLGIHALYYAQSQGWVTLSDFSPSEWTNTQIKNNPDVAPDAFRHFLSNQPMQKFVSNDVDMNLDYDASVQVNVSENGELDNSSESTIERGEKKIAFVKLNEQALEAPIKEYREVLSKFKTVTKERIEPTTAPVKFNPNTKVRNTNNFMNMTSFTKKIFNKLFNTEWTLNSELAQLALDNRKAIEAQLGIKSPAEIATMMKDDRISAKGKNAALTRELDNLFNMLEEDKKLADTHWFFRWFMSKGGRNYIDSVGVNPQSDKAITRFLVVPSAFKRTITIDSNMTMDEYVQTNDFGVVAYAIAQAFDVLKSDEKITTVARQMLETPAAQLYADLFAGEFKKDKNKYGVGLENFGHAMNVIQHIEKFQNRAATGGTFDTMLAIENDSTTSGYFIKLLQFPDSGLMKAFGDKVGILPEGYEHGWTEIHGLKALDNFLDIYKTLALKGSEKIPTSYLYARDNMYGPLANACKQTYAAMFDALPRTETVNGKPKVTSALRSLFKNPTMIFGYTAGKNSIQNALADEISIGFIRDYVSYKTNPDAYNADGKNIDAKILMKVFEPIEKMNSTFKFEGGEKVELSLIEALKEKSVSEIYLKIDKISIPLDNYFRDTLAPTYGAAVYSALDESFSAFKPFNNNMNYMFKTMFNIFDKALEAKMDTLRAKYKYGIPIKEEQAAIESLLDLMPVMRLAVNSMEETLQEGLLIMDTEKDYSLNAKTQSYYQDEKTNSVKSSMGYASMRKFIDGGQAGAVLPIHFMDGMGMSVMLDKFGDKIIPVHDAIVMSAYDNAEITQEYNKQMFKLGKEFNIFSELMFRFNEVISVAEKQGLIDPDKDYIVTGQDVNKNTPTIRKFMAEITKMNRDNVAAREAFYAKKWYITNMDGNKNSGYITTGVEDYVDDAFVEGWKSNRKLMQEKFPNQYSDPNTFTSTNKLVELQRDGLEHVGARNEIFDRLEKMFPDMTEDAGHLGTLRNIVSKIAPEHLTDFIVATRENIRNQGTLDGNTIIIDLDNRTSIDSTTRLSPYSTKSPAEIYAHEMIHAAIRFALGTGKNKFTKEIRQISRIMKQVMDTDLITWQDFMPEGEFDKALSDVYEKNAKDIWNYIFNNKDNPVNLSGIHEFVAYSMTNKRVMDKLRNQNIKGIESTSTDKISLLDRLVNFGMSMIDFVRGKGKFSEIFRTGYELVSNDFSMSQRNTMLSEMERLFMSMNNANEKAITRLRDHPVRLIEGMFRFTTKMAVQANKIVRPYTTWAANWVDETGHVFDNKIPGSMFEQGKLFANVAMGLLFSRTRRQALTGILRKAFGLSQQGTFATILREIQAPDEATAMLEQLSAYTRQLEGIGKTIEADMKLNFREAFNPTLDEKKDLKEIEKKSLTKAALYTDLGSLLKFDGNKVTNIDEIVDYLNDAKKVTNEIQRISTELAKTSGRNNNYYLNQARLLGRFMATGKGAINLNLNAKNIAEGRGSGNIINTTPETIALIDRLATMYALDYTPEDSRKVTGSLNKKGLENFLVAQNTFVKESLAEGNVEEIHMIKGYSKSIFDSNKDTKIGRIQDLKKMKEMGYHMIEGKFFGQNKITKQEGFVLYQRNWTVQRRRDGAAYVMVGANTIGTTLWESAFEIQNRIPGKPDITQVNDLAAKYKLEAETLARDMTNRMSKGIISDEEVDRMSGGYTPVTSPDGGYSDFRITMSNEDKVKYLGMNEDAFTVLSKMYASKNTKLQAPAKNKFLTDFLINDMKLNMQSSTKMSKLGKNYVRLERDSENKFLRDAYRAFPKELRDAIKKYDKEGEGLWVKDEWLQQLFGVPTVSLVDNKTVDKYTNNLMKHGIVIAEQVMKAIAYIAKQNIVMRYPAVLLGNIMSNLNLSIARGRNPSVVARRQIENAQNIRDYMINQKALNRILTRQKFGTVTEKELNSINWYETQLNNNPVKPLMDKGMFQAIMEDISLDELENTGKVNKMITTFAKNKGVPTKVKNAIKHLYMMEGTPIYEFMFQTTQYSDFVARATEYQLQMEEQLREPKLLKNGASNPAYIEKGTPAWNAFETKVSTDVWNAFINYDKPQSSAEQYLNDLGLIMFTKFLKRIQHVLMHDLIHNPVSSAFFIASQVAIVDSSDIFEYNVFNRNVTWNMFAPWTNLMNAAVPIPIQFATGTGLFK